MMETSLSPLTLTETRDIINLKAAYGQFWRSQKFAKGYDSPFCSRSDVEKALSEAAEIVVRLRSHLDRLHSEKDTKRVLAGASQEHLFALDIADTPSSFDPAQFARDLVHATLRDSQGYVEELNEGIIDNFIEQVRAYRDVRTSEQLSTIEQCEVLYNDVLQQWSRDQELLNQALPKEATERTAAFDALSLSDLQSLKAQLAAVEQTLRSLRLNRLRITRSAFLDAPDTPFHVEQQSGHHTDPTDEARAEAFAAVEQHPTTDAIVVSTTDDEHSTVTPSPTTAVDDDDDDEQHNNNNNNNNNNNEPTSVQDDAENVNETEEKAAESTTPTDEDADAQVRSEAFIAIEKVASHVDQVASEFKGMLGQVEPLWSEEQSTLCSRPIESLKKIEGLHSTVVGYSEELLQDLMRLDDIEVDPQARAERKRHVIAIQALMDDLDGVASKLKSLKDVLKVEAEKVKASSPERTASPSLSSSSSTTAASSQTPPSTHGQQQASRSSLSSAWDKLKLDLQWDKDATRRSYLIRTMIPGLDRDKIKFELAQDGSAFTISGCRVPTPHEEQELRQFIKRRYRYPPSEEDSLLLRVASGRYGSFRNTFSLPDDALPDQVRPTYDRGILQIEVPRRQVVQQRVPRSFGGYPGYPSRQGAFFNDRDLWW